MTDLVVVGDSEIQKIRAMRELIAKGCTNEEFEVFVEVCRQSGLKPMTRQIYAVKRWSKAENREVMAPQVSIDGMRSLAEESGVYRGQMGPYWCGEDGEWKDVWLSAKPPAAAKIAVLHASFTEPLWAVARYGAYVQTTSKGDPTMFWVKMPDLMLAKCAEALALRKAFPRRLSGCYTSEEMGQANTVDVEIVDPFITPSQVRLLQISLKEQGYTPEMIKAFKDDYGVESAKHLPKGKFDEALAKAKDPRWTEYYQKRQGELAELEAG
jgi:phage recombination protein Bet